jgi:ribose/xylose/arabinose/galactoside ABC-type transport system permease subunit
MSDTMKTRKMDFSKLLSHQNILLLVLIALVVGFGIMEPVFFKPGVLFDVFAIVGEIGLMAMGMTFIISTGGVDLGVGYNLQMSAIVFGVTYSGTGNLALAIIVALLTGMAGGFFNGLVISRTRIPSLVTTLATMYLYRGISMIVAGTRTFSGFPEGFQKISTIELFGFLPIQSLYLIGVFLILDFFYERGALGRNLKGMGFNENAVVFSGVNTRRIKLGIYTLLGLICGLAALVYLGRLSAAKTSMGDYMNFEVITAVLIGGTSIMGGVGSMRGTLIGVLIIGVLKKGFTLLNFSGNIYNFTLGLILILSLIIFALEEERKKAVSRESGVTEATEETAQGSGSAET